MDQPSRDQYAHLLPDAIFSGFSVTIVSDKISFVYQYRDCRLIAFFRNIFPFDSPGWFIGKEKDQVKVVMMYISI